MAALLEAWRAEHGPNWQLIVREGTNHLELLYGDNIPATATPLDDGEFFALAYQSLADSQPLHGIDLDTLIPDRVTFLPLGRIGSSDKIAVRFLEKVGNVPVRNGFVNVLFSAEGALLAIQSTGLPYLSGFGTVPGITADSALGIASATFGAETGVTADSALPPQLVIGQAALGGPLLTARLAWQVDVFSTIEGVRDEGRQYLVDAASGEILEAIPNIHHLGGVRGRVLANATPGLKPDIACPPPIPGPDPINPYPIPPLPVPCGNPPVPHPMVHLLIRGSSGGTTWDTVTDSNGEFFIPNVPSPISMTLRFRGIEVGTYQGAPIYKTEIVSGENPLTWSQYESPSFTFSPGTTTTEVLMNSPPSEGVTAQANAFRSISHLRDWAETIIPSTPSAPSLVQEPVFAQVNGIFGGGCVANYPGLRDDGAGWLYFNRRGTNGDGESCYNLAYSTTVSHEHGHHLNYLYGTGNSFDGMGEGNASVWAMYAWDTPLVGEDSHGTGRHQADGMDPTPFCGDDHPSCYGNSHLDGRPWYGAAWKVRVKLQTTYEPATAKLIADHLFLGWMVAFDQAALKSIIETQWLLVDDDDGNLCYPRPSPTPHFADIDFGFRWQGFPGVNAPGPGRLCSIE